MKRNVCMLSNESVTPEKYVSCKSKTQFGSLNSFDNEFIFFTG